MPLWAPYHHSVSFSAPPPARLFAFLALATKAPLFDAILEVEVRPFLPQGRLGVLMTSVAPLECGLQSGRPRPRRKRLSGVESAVGVRTPILTVV